MHFVLDKNEKIPLFVQAQEQLLIALHTGKVRPGDRLPSVRLVASNNKINIKTAFAIYRHLQDDGYITLRTGSGAYVADLNQIDLEQAYHLSLLKLIKSNLSEAQRLKLDPASYASLVGRFIDQSHLEQCRVGVVECNNEQVSLFSKEISDRLRVRVIPLLLDQLESRGRKMTEALEQIDCFATTDFHFRQVRSLANSYGKRVLQLRLNPNFIPTIIEAARRGSVLMIVSDTDYFPAFKHRLLDLGIKPAVIERITAVACNNASRLRAELARAKAVYVSPLCESRVNHLIPPHVKELKMGGLLSGESIEMLHAAMLFIN